MSPGAGPRAAAVPAAPAENRVTPLGEVVAAPGRGSWTGNRGRLHDGAGTRVVRRHHVGRAWITCVLAFRDRHVAQWHPGHYTPLFFLDEAVALAAGHRPCAECRRADYVRFRDLVAEGLGADRLAAPELDRLLHEERWDSRHRTRRLHAAPWAELPDGAFVLLDAGPVRVAGERLVPWRADNSYAPAEDAVARPSSGTATLLTPPSSLDALRRGYPVQVGAQDA